MSTILQDRPIPITVAKNTNEWPSSHSFWYTKTDLEQLAKTAAATNKGILQNWRILFLEGGGILLQSQFTKNGKLYYHNTEIQ